LAAQLPGLRKAVSGEGIRLLICGKTADIFDYSHVFHLDGKTMDVV